MIEFRNVTAVKKRKLLLDNVCFKLSNGKIYGIYGNPEEISEIANLLSGARIPADGSVLINGFDLSREASRAKAFLGFVPSDTVPYPCVTAVEYLLFLADVRQIDYEKSIRDIGDALSFVGLSGKREVLIRHLSTYEKKCLLLAGALLSDTEFLIFHDPFSSLNASEAESFANLIEDASIEKTAIICSPASKYLSKICNVLYVLKNHSLETEAASELLSEGKEC